MSSNYEKVKEARAAGAWKNQGHEDLMKGVLAAAFPDDAAAETSH